jgi:putative DNA methylase
MTDFPRLIEHAFPLKQASLDSVHEKTVRYGHIAGMHLWPARRPLAACRAALIATLLPDPSAEPKPDGMSDAQWEEEIKRRRKELCEKIGGRIVKRIEKKKMPNGQTVERVKEETEGGILHWGRETENAETLEWFRQEIRKAYGGRAPKVLDPFAGGGAIPLEAMRLGCEATAVDINPVAWFILKCTLEYPQKLAGQTRPLPDFILHDDAFMTEFFTKAKGYSKAEAAAAIRRLHAGSKRQAKPGSKQPDAGLLFGSPEGGDAEIQADLAWHVRAWGQWVLARARRELAQYYPTYADFDLPAASRRSAAQAGPHKPPVHGLRGPFFAYIIRCADDSFYVGQTDDLARRWEQHQRGEVSWTAPRRPLELVHWERFDTREDAVKRESDLKTGFGRTWIKREYAAGRLKGQELAKPRLLPLKDDGTPDIDALNAEFTQEYLEDQRNPRWVAKPTVAYLWARTVKCKNCRATVPLLKTRWLCKKKSGSRQRTLLTIEPDHSNGSVAFGIEDDVPARGGNPAQRREHDKKVGEGTMSRSGARCPCCGTIMTMSDMQVEGRNGRMGFQLTCVAVEGDRKKQFRLPTSHELTAIEEAAASAHQAFDRIPFGFPHEHISEDAKQNTWCAQYGMRTFDKLFLPRQLAALGGVLKRIRESWTPLSAYGDSSWQEGIYSFLLCGFTRLLDFCNCGAQWKIDVPTINHLFVRFAIPISWDFAESNPVGRSAGSYELCLERIAVVLDSYARWSMEAPYPHAQCCSSMSCKHDKRFDAVVTDPPYYDAIGYSVVMDFFHVWLRRAVSDTIGEGGLVFSEPTGPKWSKDTGDGELVDDASRHDGDATVSKAVYEEGMYQVFSKAHAALKEDGRVVIVFAHKDPIAWETLAAAVIRAGFVVETSWPIQTEQASRMRALSSAALASSVWLVCRKRPETSKVGWDNNVLADMRQNITKQLREFWDAGIRGPDFVWAATGPALQAYSKHPVVKKADKPGEIMTVSEFLTHVRRMVVDYIVGQVLSGEQGADLSAADRLDEVTAYYLLHRHDFGMEEAPVGACILYATACGLSDAELERSWDILVGAGGAGGGDAPADDLGEDDDAEGDYDDAGGEGGGNKVKLKAWSQRKGRSLGYEAPEGKAVPLIDRIHRLMHLWKDGDLHKVDEYIDEHGLRRNELFRRVVQSLIELSTNSERSLLESISNHIGAKGAVRDRGPELFEARARE